MGKFDKDIRSWRTRIAENKRRVLALFRQRHQQEDASLAEVRGEVSFLRAQSARLRKFIDDYRRRDRT